MIFLHLLIYTYDIPVQDFKTITVSIHSVAEDASAFTTVSHFYHYTIKRTNYGINYGSKSFIVHAPGLNFKELFTVVIYEFLW